MGLLCAGSIASSRLCCADPRLARAWWKQGEGRGALTAAVGWSSDPKQFPLDISAAIQWLKARNDVDVNRIAMIGCELGADLAFLASGKFEEVRSAIVISGDAGNAGVLSKAIPDFQPHSILFIATQGDSQAVEFSSRVRKANGVPRARADL